MLTLIKTYTIYRYSSILEDQAFRSKSADYFQFIILLTIALLLACYYMSLPSASQWLSATFIYIWAKKNPKISINFFGIFNFRAFYLPYGFLLTNILLKGNIWYDLFGIMVGHVYYFLYFVVPILPQTRGINIMTAPAPMQYLTDLLGLDLKRELLLEEADFIDDVDFQNRVNNGMIN